MERNGYFRIWACLRAKASFQRRRRGNPLCQSAQRDFTKQRHTSHIGCKKSHRVGEDQVHYRGIYRTSNAWTFHTRLLISTRCNTKSHNKANLLLAIIVPLLLLLKYIWIFYGMCTFISDIHVSFYGMSFLLYALYIQRVIYCTLGNLINKKSTFCKRLLYNLPQSLQVQGCIVHCIVQWLD